MYDTYMSEEAFDNLTAGDEVTVRSLDDLIHDFGADINVPCGWSSDMDELCGQTLIVDYVERARPNHRFWYPSHKKLRVVILSSNA